jgi:hypothetical protein
VVVRRTGDLRNCCRGTSLHHVQECPPHVRMMPDRTERHFGAAASQEITPAR